jgi:HD-GYP domain-containing protein (c-di-GMP phosphodiesterase class II)
MRDCVRALEFIGAMMAPAGMAQAADVPGRSPQPVSARAIAAFAAGLEARGRQDGVAAALRLFAVRGDHSHSPALMALVDRRLRPWLAELDAIAGLPPAALQGGTPADMVPLEWMADLIDFQQPWLDGHSRRVAAAAQQAAGHLGLDAAAQRLCRRAGLVHGLGRGAVAGAAWHAAGPLPAGAREQLRLAPYWTRRALGGSAGLAEEGEIASFMGERLDGSGNFRGAIGAAIPLEGQVLAVAAAWVGLQSARPWRAAYPAAVAREILQRAAAGGRFHPGAVAALCGAPDAAPGMRAGNASRIGLSGREAAVLRAIGKGCTNKEIARALAISPRTIGTHVESAFKKLGCTTRAAAALKALTLRLI